MTQISIFLLCLPQLFKAMQILVTQLMLSRVKFLETSSTAAVVCFEANIGSANACRGFHLPGNMKLNVLLSAVL